MKTRQTLPLLIAMMFGAFVMVAVEHHVYHGSQADAVIQTDKPYSFVDNRIANLTAASLTVPTPTFEFPTKNPTIDIFAEWTAPGAPSQTGTDFRADSQITNAISGLFIIRNKTNDYSLKAVSGDGTKNVTLIRFAGTSAEADISTVYHLFAKTFEVLGVRFQ